MSFMKKGLLALAGIAIAAGALAAVTLTNSTNPTGWQLVRGTTNVGTLHATEAACRTAAINDAETRKASANYRCVYSAGFRATWTANPPPVVVDPHNGGTHSGNMPSYNVATIPAPAAGSGEWQVRTTGEMPYPMADGTGAFRTLCTRSHFNRDDSLVFPGQPGRAHLHMYFGNTASDANSTPESILASGNSTCRGGIANRSSYWVPAIIDTRDGAVMDMDYVDIYYKTGYRGVPAADVRPFPVGLRMIAGDMRRTTEQPWGPTEFRCDGVRSWGMPVNCTGALEAHVVFPQCWNGRDLYAADQSHMAYANGGCPASHPVPLPEISYIVHFNVPAGRSTSTWRLSSDNYVGGQGGYSMHGDWINGWNPSLPPIWTERVLNPGLSGGSHIIGDGRVMY